MNDKLPSRVVFSENYVVLEVNYHSLLYNCKIRIQITNARVDGKIDKAQVAGVTNDVIFDRNYIRGGIDLLLVIFCRYTE